jgi:hypothetical protein
MLRYLLDEHISPAIARELRQKHPGILVEALQTWSEGAFLGQPDAAILRAANNARLTLVTYDQATIPTLLLEWAALGIPHSGVIFVSQRSLPSNNFGPLITALFHFWQTHQHHNWKNRIGHLTPKP